MNNKLPYLYKTTYSLFKILHKSWIKWKVRKLYKIVNSSISKLEFCWFFLMLVFSLQCLLVFSLQRWFSLFNASWFSLFNTGFLSSMPAGFLSSMPVGFLSLMLVLMVLFNASFLSSSMLIRTSLSQHRICYLSQ